MAEFETVRRAGVGVGAAQIDEGLRAHMSKVYGLMAVAMVITGIAAWMTAQMAVSAAPTQYQVGNMYLTDFGAALYTSPLRWVVMLLPLAFVFGLGATVNRLSTGAAQLVFYAFALAMGVSISSIFIVFTHASIAQVFLVTAIAFAGLSLWGYTTRRDISAWGSFLFMGLIGLIAAMLINWWLQSPALAFAVSAIGVLVFAGLTAYDTQNIKNTYLQMRSAQGEAYLGKAAIMGALSLYLNFLNMFMMLLQLFGNRN